MAQPRQQCHDMTHKCILTFISRLFHLLVLFVVVDLWVPAAHRVSKPSQSTIHGSGYILTKGSCPRHPRRSSWFEGSGTGIVCAPPMAVRAPNAPNAHSTGCTRSMKPE